VRGRLAEVRALGAEPCAIIPDGALGAAAFLATLDYPFPVLIDADQRVAAAYGALAPEGKARPTLVVVGDDGRLLHRQAGVPPVEELLTILGGGTGGRAAPSPRRVSAPAPRVSPSSRGTRSGSK
jgi:peroxiredoxin